MIKKACLVLSGLLAVFGLVVHHYVQISHLEQRIAILEEDAIADFVATRGGAVPSVDQAETHLQEQLIEIQPAMAFGPRADLTPVPMPDSTAD